MFLTSVILTGLSLAADEPTLHQIYQAADGGHMIEAQGMMEKVLREHPNSAKAHFVQAELLVKQGHLANAQVELSKAEILAPGLPFAKPDAVENLKRHIASSHTAAPVVQNTTRVQQSEVASVVPWGLLLVVLGLIAAVVFFVRSMSRRSTSASLAGGGAMYGAGFGLGAPLQPAGASGMTTPPVGPTAGGIGSGILGGLATGAALGAGMVAGQALMHHFTDGNRNEAGLSPLPSSVERDITPNDMGGSDFGVSDSSSWDDTSSGGSDWE